MTSSVSSGIKILLLLGLWSWSLSGQKQTLRGSITHAETTAFLEGVKVTVHETEETVWTDKEGQFQIALKEGHYHLHFEKAGFIAQDRWIHFPEESIIQLSMLPSNIELDELLVEDGFFNQNNSKISQQLISVRVDEREQATQLDLSTMLAKQPGLNALNTGVGVAKPIVRGFMGNRVAVIDEGIKQEGQQWGMDHGLEIDPFQVQRLELIKGPAALQYGSDAIGGALRILPEALPEKQWTAQALLNYHSNNQAIGASAATAYRKGGIASGIRISTRDYHDFRVPAETFVYNGFVLPITDNTLKNTAGNMRSVLWYLSQNKDNYRARYRVSYYQQEQGLYPGATGIPRAFDVGNIGSTSSIGLPSQEIRHYKLFSTQNIKLGDHWLESEWAYQFNDRAELSIPHAHGFEELDSGDVLALGLKLHSAQLNMRYRFHWGKQDFIIGTSQQYQRNFSDGFEYLIPNYNSWQSGLFLLANGSINEKIRWDGGLRWEYKHQQSPLSTTRWWNNFDSIVVRSAAVDRVFSNVAAATGLVYQASSSWLFKVHVARSFRAPNVAELSSNGVHHGTFRHEVGDETINPELAWQLDANMEYRQRDFFMRLSPFYYYFENFIFLRPTAQFSLLPEAGQLYEYQQAPILQGGAEFFLDWHPWADLHLSSGTEFLLNRNLQTGLPLPFSPPWSNLFNLSWEKEKWQVGVNWRYTAAQNRVDRNEDETPEYHLFGAEASYAWEWGGQAFQMHVSVQNLMDEFYLRHLSRYRILNLPEQGRNVVFGISWRL